MMPGRQPKGRSVMSSIRPTSNVVSAFAAAVVIIAMSCLPAHAGVQTDREMTGDDILAALQSATPQTMFAAAAVDIEEGDPDEVTYRSGSVTAQIDADPAEGVTLTRGSLRISMSVPDASDVSSLPTSNGDLVVYGGEGDASVVPVIVRDGSIQLNAIIPSRESPDAYRFDIDIPAGAHLERDGTTGAISVFLNDGTWIAGISAPWARDASGRSLPTEYEIAGSQIIQHIDMSSEDVSFPVVADPWLGANLIDHTTWERRSPAGLTLRVYPTPWGRYWTSQPTWPAHWGELLSKTTSRSLVNTTYMMNQYFCHIQLGASYWKDSYNLDTFVRRNSLWDYIVNKCN